MPAPIMKAIRRNDVSTFQALTEKNPSALRERDHSETLGGTILHLATKLRHSEIVERVIKICPALIGVTNNNGETPLHYAARWGLATIATQMVESEHADFTLLNKRGETAFVVACRYTHLDIAGLILEKSSSMTIKEFYATISGGFLGLSTRMLARFPELASTADEKFCTPLHYACYENHLEMVKMLLGLDERLANMFNKDGFTPLHLAVMKCSVSVSILKEFSDKAPTSFNTPTPTEKTVFHLAAEHKNIPAFFFLAESSDRRKLLLRVDIYGNTVLHMAVMSSCYSVIVYITHETTIDLSAKNIQNLEAIDLINVDDEDYSKISSWLRFDAKQIRNPSDPNGQPGNHNTGELSKYYGQPGNHNTYYGQPGNQNTYYGGQPGYYGQPGNHNTYYGGQPGYYGQPGNHNTYYGGQPGNHNTYYGQPGNHNTEDLSKYYNMRMGETYGRPTSRENKMHVEAMQNARNTITIVAVLIASVAFTSGINPPGGVYQEGPNRGQSVAGKTLAFKIFSISNNLALFSSLCIVILLVSIIPYRTRPLMNFLKLTHRIMWVAVASMATAFVSAASITLPHAEGTRWLFITILSISTVMLGGLFAFMTYKMITHSLKKKTCERPPSNVVENTYFPTSAYSVTSDWRAAGADGYYFY